MDWMEKGRWGGRGKDEEREGKKKAIRWMKEKRKEG